MKHTLGETESIIRKCSGRKETAVDPEKLAEASDYTTNSF